VPLAAAIWLVTAKSP